LAANQVITSTTELARSLETELAGFRDFVQALQTEQEALIQGNVDSLIELARLKSEKVVFLSQLAERRNRFLGAQGANPENGGMMNWLHQQKTGQTVQHLAETWKQLLEQAEIARQLNQINGTLIESRLRHNQQALVVLQAAANQSVGLYGPDGQTHASGLGRPLGKV
jgi:flagella synthesis protein FlgN